MTEAAFVLDKEYMHAGHGSFSGRICCNNDEYMKRDEECDERQDGEHILDPLNGIFRRESPFHRFMSWPFPL
jgi:hypothetical protein